MTKIKLNLPNPIHDVQRQILNFILDKDPTTRVCIVAAGTKSGKSFINGVGLTNLIHSEKQTLCRWFAPQYIQSQIGLKYVKRFLPLEHPKLKHMYEVKNSGTPTITMKQLDNTVQFLHAQKPELVEGEATRLNLLDEAAKYKNLEDFIQAVRTTTTFTKGKIVLFSTPLGKNHFYKEYQKALEEMHLAKQNNRKPTAIALHAPTKANPFVDEATLDYMRNTMPERLYKQYVLAEFVDESTTFGDVSSNFDSSQKVLDSIETQQFWLHTESKVKEKVFIGVDWGKQSDYTVFTALYEDPENRIVRLVGVQRFRRVSYVQAVDNLKNFVQNFDRVEEIYHDKTGVGVAIDDILEDQHIIAEGIIFTNNSKTEMVLRLMLYIEKNLIIFPRYEILKNELNNFETSFTRSGKMHFEAASGTTDDIICSILLSLTAVTDIGGDFSVRVIEDP